MLSPLDSFDVASPVFPYTRMRTREVGGGNELKNTCRIVMTQTHKPQECNQSMKQGLGEDRVADKSAKQCLECSVFP